MDEANIRRRGAGRAARRFAMAGRELLKDAAGHALDFTEARQIVLEFLIQDLRFLRTELVAQDHVAKLDGVWQHRVFLQFLERSNGIVVVHEFPRSRE
jgi:hypothetical protein